jgi:hypothetical protein
LTASAHADRARRCVGPDRRTILCRVNANALKLYGNVPVLFVNHNFYLAARTGTYQAWVALSARPVVDHVRKFAAKGLARDFGEVTPDSASQGFGRLAGFTFDDDNHEPALKRRFVLAHEGLSTVASNGDKLLAHIGRALRELKLDPDRKRTKERKKGKDLGDAVEAC